MPKIGHFILHSNVMPPITAGRYELVSEMSGLPFDVEPEHTHFHVAAPRYVMPPEQILSSFPPANAEGAFGDRLPQIVLKRRTLPWERNPAGGTAPSPVPWLALVVVAEGEAELSGATPVAQCFTAGTPLQDPNDKDVEQGLYLAVTETVLKKIFPCEQDLPLLTHVREVDVHDTELANGDDDGFLAVVLANRLPVFDQASGKAVRYMACLVNVEGQLPRLPQPQPPVPAFEWALAQDWSVLAQANVSGGPDVQVMGGKGQGVAAGVLPQAGVRRGRRHPEPRAAAARAVPAGVQGSAFAQFVATKPATPVGQALDGAGAMSEPAVGSQWAKAAPVSQATQAIAAAALDPDAKRLVRDTMGIGFRLPIGLYALEPVFRFPVLAHWSFTTNEGATFETLLQDVDVGLLGAVPNPTPKKAPLPGQPDPLPPPPVPEGPEVVETGHIGLAHTTRRGDAVRAWYRGPCVPFPTPRHGGTVKDATAAEPLPLAHSADQLRRTIPDGREDLALAAAFEIGRLLALSQLSVVSALMRFRAEQFGAGRVRELLAQVLEFPLPGLAGAAHTRPDLGRFVALEMVRTLAQSPAAMLGPRRAVADPGRPLAVNGELDAVIAAGLGIDLAALNRRAASVGALAALEQTAVPLALKPGQQPSPDGALPALKQALQAELARTLRVALPQASVGGVVGGVTGGVLDGGTVVRRGRAEPDALDRLIASTAEEGDDEEEAPQ